MEAAKVWKQGSIHASMQPNDVGRGVRMLFAIIPWFTASMVDASLFLHFLPLSSLQYFK